MLTPSQKSAFDRMMAGESLYVAGAAGVGKSFLLAKFIDESRSSGKNVMVTAPTGIAALSVGGSTIHSALGFPSLGKEVKASDELIATDILVIDEISMCRIDLFDHVLKKLEDANKERRNAGKDEIQLVCVGDFGQLPPVVKDEDKEYLKAFFPDASGEYAFEHPKWNLSTVQLTEVVRQRNPDFATALNQIRLGDPEGLDYINKHCSKKPIQDGIWVLATNKKVRGKNREELNKLKGKRKTFTAYTSGKYEEPTDEQLTLVEGCRVVSLINENGFYNGSLGTIVELNDSSVTVKFDNGILANVGRHKWETKRPKLIEKEDGSKHLSEEVIGSFEQLPLKLAYAVTIHKSQGQTYGAMNADPYCFAPGQLYVELSRAESVEELYLTRDITEKDLRVDPKVIDFYKDAAPVTVSDIAYSIDDETKEDQHKDKTKPDSEKTEDLNDSATTKTAKKLEPSKSEPAKRKKRGIRKMDNEKEKEVANDTVSARVSAETKAAYEKVMAAMEGESKAIKFKNLVKAAGEANVLTAKTGSDKEAYEDFVTHTTRLAEGFNELLKRKNELADTIRLEYQSQFESKDATIFDLQSKVSSKEDQIKNLSDEKKYLLDQIKILEAKAKEIDNANEKAASAEEALKDSRFACASLQEKIAKLEMETEGFDDLKAERDDLEKEKERLSERLEEKTTEATYLKERVSDLESKLATEKDGREQDRAEHVTELARVHKDAVDKKDSAVKDAREDERKYWQEQLEKLQDKLDQEKDKHAKEHDEFERLKMELDFIINPKIAELEKENTRLKEQEELQKEDKKEVK